MASYHFHSEAADEYLAATRYYLDYASPLVAAAFVGEIEAAIQTLLASPTTWPVIEEPQIRRYLVKTIPLFALLSVGAGAGSSFHLCSDAFQPSAWLLARSNFNVREFITPTRKLGINRPQLQQS